MARYMVQAAPHRGEDGKDYLPGEVVESDKDLLSEFPGKFKKLPDEPKQEAPVAVDEEPAGMPTVAEAATDESAPMAMEHVTGQLEPEMEPPADLSEDEDEENESEGE